MIKLCTTIHQKKKKKDVKPGEIRIMTVFELILFY